MALALSQPKKFQPFGPRVHKFAFRPPAQDAQINLLEGTVRSSKTWSCLVKFLFLCKYGVAGRKVLTGVSKQTVYQNFLVDLFEILGSKNYTYNRSNGELWALGTEWIVVGARDEGSEKVIRGMTIGAAICDELTKMPLNFFMMLLSRMSPAGSRLYATTNADHPGHWVKTEIIDNPRYTRGIGKQLWVEKFTMEDNPTLSEEFKDRIKRSYTGVWYERFVLGLWVMAEGGIYRDALTEENYYTNATRLPSLLKPNGHLEHWLSIDYGTVNPFVAIDIYDTGHDIFWEREYYWDSRKEARQKTDAEYAEDLLTFIGRDVDPRYWPGVIIDPSAASMRIELFQRGFVVIDADNEVDDGIRRLSTLLKRKLIHINKDNCPNIIREMQSYAWDPKPVEKGKDTPLKKNDHGPDAGRYHCKTRIGDWRIS